MNYQIMLFEVVMEKLRIACVLGEKYGKRSYVLTTHVH